MSLLSRLAVIPLSALTLAVALPVSTEAQRRAVPRHPPHPPAAVQLRGHVFVGGYFYDPVFGPYPWWQRTTYPYWYYPVFDRRAEVRIKVQPKQAEDAAVYVDGFYAGIVDDFNGVFQGLPVTPGGHSIVLYLEGYRTVRHNLYLAAGSALTLHDTLQPVPPGEASELPDIVPAVPPPPAGSYRLPVTPPRRPTSPIAPQMVRAEGFGTVDVSVQPSDAEVRIDGQRWATSEAGHFMIQLTRGTHRLEVTKAGYRTFTTELTIRDGETSALNVSLLAGTH